MGFFLQQSFAMFSLLLSFLCSYPSRFLRETFPLLEKKKALAQIQSSSILFAGWPKDRHISRHVLTSPVLKTEG